MAFPLSIQVVDLLAPLHGRTSCNDRMRSNGFNSNGHGQPPRCTRCALLQMLEDPETAADIIRGYGLQLEVYFMTRPWIVGDECPKCHNKPEGPNFCNYCGNRL